MINISVFKGQASNKYLAIRDNVTWKWCLLSPRRQNLFLSYLFIFQTSNLIQKFNMHAFCVSQYQGGPQRFPSPSFTLLVPSTLCHGVVCVIKGTVQKRTSLLILGYKQMQSLSWTLLNADIRCLSPPPPLLRPAISLSFLLITLEEAYCEQLCVEAHIERNWSFL